MFRIFLINKGIVDEKFIAKMSEMFVLHKTYNKLQKKPQTFKGYVQGNFC